MEQKTKSILRLVKNEDCPVNETTNVGGTVFLANDASASHTPSTDMIGYEVFSDGDIGQAHVIAHKYHDIERPDLGYQFLKDWLTGRTGTGSDWIHIQFHMALFELDLGQWCDAYTRFKQNILPGAAFTDHALTDAPALLWRLMMSAPFQVDYPWESIARIAARQLTVTQDPFIQAHNLLALGGAKDSRTLKKWSERQAHDSHPALRDLAHAMIAHVWGDHHKTASILQMALDGFNNLGGSAAQRGLFKDIKEYEKRLTHSSQSPRNLNTGWFR